MTGLPTQLRIAEVSFLRILAVVLCVSTLAVAAAGCGSSGGSSKTGAKPDAWAAEVCGALRDWAQGLKSSSTSLNAQLATATSIEAAKAKFIAFLDTAAKTADVMVARVRKEGPPAVDKGEALQSDLEAALGRFGTSFRHASTKARKLPTNNRQAFSSGVTSLGKDVVTELAATGDVFTKLGERFKDKDLSNATKNQPACQRVSG